MDRVHKLLFLSILAIGTYNTICLIEDKGYFFYNSFLLTMLVISSFLTLHFYYVVYRDVELSTPTSWLHAAATMSAILLLDVLMRFPNNVVFGDAAILTIVLLSCPRVIKRGHFKNIKTKKINRTRTF